MTISHSWRIRGPLAIVILLVPVTWVAIAHLKTRIWDHFDVVKHGTLYRSGQLEPEQFESAIRLYGIRTVVNFQVAGAGVDQERALAESLGVDFMNLPMPGDGSGDEAQFREALKAVDDPERRPVLVHCARGTCRTGAAVGLYRLEHDGWTIDDVAAEMRRQAYRDGWLPGYVYAMVKERPFDERYEPRIRYDRNLDQSIGSANPRTSRRSESPHGESTHSH